MIYYHTGSGNSRHVAELLAGILGEGLCRIAPGGSAAPSHKGERVIWVFPVYSWGVPPIVRSFMLRSRGLEGASHYMVCTCGDDVGLTHLQWRRIARSLGWKAVGCWSVQMPNNYVLLPGFDVDPARLEADKLDACGARVAAVARGIRHGARVDDVVRGSMPWVKSRILYPLFMRFLMSPRPFRHTDACIGCGKCAAGCPCSNIVMDSGRPRWVNAPGSDSCAMCLACYHHCPVHAVAYGKRTARKGQYVCPAQPGPHAEKRADCAPGTENRQSDR